MGLAPAAPPAGYVASKVGGASRCKALAASPIVRDEDQAPEFLRRDTSCGPPLVGDGLISKFEKPLDRRLCPLPAGRPTNRQATREDKNNEIT